MSHLHESNALALAARVGLEDIDLLLATRLDVVHQLLRPGRPGCS